MNKLAEFIADLLPNRVCYWVLVRIFAQVSTEEFKDKIGSTITIFEAAEAWRKR